jgi:hypothetical protein
VTDRHSGYIVALDADMREDDAEAIVAAISMIKGVLAVTPLVADPSETIARLRIRRQILTKMYEAFDNA